MRQRYLDPVVLADTYRNIMSLLYKDGLRDSEAYKYAQKCLRSLVEITKDDEIE